MSAEKKIDPATVIGQKFRLAAVEIEDKYSPHAGGHLVKVFARFSGLEDNPQDMSKLRPARLSLDDLVDMMSVIVPPKKRWWMLWEEAQPIPTLEQVEIFHDMRRNSQVPNLIQVLCDERSRYYDEMSKPKRIIKPLAGPQ